MARRRYPAGLLCWLAVLAAAAYGPACSAATLVNFGSDGKYFKGISEASNPVAAWRAIGFDDAAWLPGTAPIYYGENTGGAGTPLNDMRYNYSCVFMRQTFTVTDPAAIAGLRLDIDFDDGFIVWINGTLVQQVYAPGTVVYSGIATASHESSYGGGTISTYTLPNPQTYLVTGLNVIAVQGFNNSLNDSTDFAVNLALSTTDPPANDNFASAAVLSGALPIAVVGSSNSLATSESGEPRHGGTAAAVSLWWSWTPTAPATVTISTAGSNFDTRLGVYTGSSVSALALVADNDDQGNSITTSLVSFNALAGTTYYIAVDGFGGATGSITLRIGPPPTVSIVATDPAAAEAGPDAGTFTVTRTGSTAAALSVFFSVSGTASDYADYTPLGSAVTLTAGQATRTLTVTPVDDAACEGDETVIVTLSFDAAYNIDPAKNTATATIADNEPAVTGKVADTQFSAHRGFYSAPFDLSITTATPGATIRYTADGSPPSPTAGTIYTAPLHIAGTTVLRALAYKAGMEPTNVDTHSYIFVDDVVNQSPTGAPPAGWPSSWSPNTTDYGMDPDIVTSATYGPTIRNDLKTIPSYSFVMKLPDLFDYSTGIYANAWQDGRDWERPCSFELLDPAAGGLFQADGGVRIRGGYSRDAGNPKHAFRLFFRSEYGLSKLSYRAFGPEPAAASFDNFDLRTFQNYSWSYGGDSRGVFIRDMFSRDTQRDMGQLRTRGDYYHLYINGQYWGLYNTEERAEGSFAASYLGGNKEDYDVIKVDAGPYTIYATDGNMDAWTRLWKAAKAGLATNDAYYRIQGRNADGTVNPAYENLLDVDNMIDYMLVIYFGGNLDAPISNFLGNASPNNFYGLRSRVGTAGFKFTSHDAEHTLLNINENRLGPYSAGDTLNKSNPQWVFQQCQANAEFCMRAADRIQKRFFNGGALTPAACTARFMARKNEIDRAVVGESARWGDAKTHPALTRDGAWLTEINRILNNYFNATPKTRSQIVLEQLIAKGLYPNLSAPQFSQLGGNIAPGFHLTISNPNAFGRIYYTINGTDPRAVGGAIVPGTLDGGTTSVAVTLSATTTVKARILNGSTWSAVLEATFYCPQDFTGLRITEIMYNPPDWGTVDGNDLEFVELKNTGATTLDLSGVQSTGGISFIFPNGTSMAPGQFIVLASNTAQFHAKYPSITPLGQYAGHLANEGETLALAYANGGTIVSVKYDDDPPWPAAADGLGFSLVPLNPNSNPDPDDARNWRASTNAGGSPGADDPASATARILVNEALTHSDLPLVDAIELYNPGAVPVNIGGWYLTDSRSSPKKYCIPGGTILGAGQYLAFTEEQFNVGPTSFSLDSNGESVYVFAADLAGNLTGYSHGFDFGAAATGVSFGRYTISTGEDHFPAMVNRTLGSANPGPRVGPVVISEIMYNPAAGGDKFIELVNVTDAAVPLYDPANLANAWKINGLAYTFPANTEIPARGILVVCGSGITPAAFRTKYSVPAGAQVLGPFTGVLQAGGEMLELQRPDEPGVDGNGNPYVPYVTVDAVRYNEKAPWPLEPNGNGPSLARIDADAYGNDPINWHASPVNGGTPGTVESFLPAPPADLTATAVSSHEIDLSWTDASQNEDGFRIERSADGVSGWSLLISLGANVASYRDSGLPYSTTCYYRVVAHNGFGDSGYSTVASARTLDEPPPEEPSDLTAATVSDVQIDLSWADNAGNETGYNVYWSPDGDTDWYVLARDLPPGTTAYQDTNLSAGATYYYKVCAYNASGSSGYSNIAGATTLLMPRPAAPTGLSGTAFSNSQIDLAWTDNATNEAGYKVERSPDGVGDWSEIAQLGADAASYRDSGLAVGATWYYRVCAYNLGSSSWYSNIANVATLNIALPADPTGLTAVAVSPTQINLSWSDNADNEDSYRVERSATGTSDWAEIVSLLPDVTGYQNSGLQHSNRYYYRVYACNLGGPSGYSLVADAATATPAPPATPTGLVASASSTTSIDLTWTDAATDETGYLVERSADGVGNWTRIADLGIGADDYQDVGLLPRTTYYCRVAAVNDWGTSYSTVASATTHTPPPPADPTDLAATALSATRVDLSWDDNATDETGYKAERSLDGTSGWTVVATLPANATAYLDASLLPLATYYYRVVAFHAYGSSAYTNTASATTMAQDFSKLQITELMYNPPAIGAVDGEEYEFIELKNTGLDTLYLSGVQFSAGITYSFPGGATLAPGQFAVLVSNPVEFARKYPSVSITGVYSGHLSDGGEKIALANAGGAEFLSFAYGDAPPWPATPDGLGFSLVPVNATANPDPDAASNWRPSVNAGGSPGADDPVAPPFAPLVVNEILTHSDPPFEDFIELFNPTDTAADIGGWYLTDDRTAPKKFAIPAGSTVAARGYVVFWQHEYAASFALSEYGEDVYLFSADGTGNLTGYAHGFKFTAAENSIAFGRYTVSTGDDHYPAQLGNTPGAANAGPRVGPVVVNEIMYFPAAGGDEFVELRNITGSPVKLYDPANPANTWKLDGVAFSFPQGIELAADGLLVLSAVDPAAFRAKYGVPDSVQVLGPYTGNLQDDGERVELQKPGKPDVLPDTGQTIVPYIIVDAVRYNDKAPWPATPAGIGPSLERITASAYGNDPINWRASSRNGGSPGRYDGGYPAAPTSLAATATADLHVNLTWTDVSANESGFRVERSADGTGGWAQVAAVGANVISWQDSGLTAATTYFYRVYAENASGASACSNVASATTFSGGTVDSDGDGYSDEEEGRLGTNPHDANSKPGGASDFDHDGLPDDKDSDADGDRVNTANELLDGTDPYDASSFLKTPMQVLKLQCSARFDAPGKDACAVSGIIPGMAPLFNPSGKTLTLVVGGAEMQFTLDPKGRGKTPQGTIMLKMKLTRNAQTKKREFLGGAVPFSAKVRKVAWAESWGDYGFDPEATMPKVAQDMDVDVWLDGRIYGATVTGTYSSKANQSAKLKK